MLAHRQLEAEARLLAVVRVQGVTSSPVSSTLISSSKAGFWIETIALVGAIACALALVIAALGMVSLAAAVQPGSSQSKPSPGIPSQTYEGMITDTHCGARHSAAIGKTASDCAILCVRAGEKFVLVDGDTIYILEGDLMALKHVAGQRARITGVLNGNTISVTAVATR
jgi:hypothetical protein